MDDFVFVDALTGDTITQNYQTGVLSINDHGDVPAATSIFFPGCSMINYAMPLVDAVYKTLREHGEADGISVLCCGKILSYEPDGENIRASFEQQLRDHLAATSIQRIICACPNCVKALREALSMDVRTRDIELVVLPKLMAQLGYNLDSATVSRIIKGDASEKALLCTHDSCPDREYGDFADGLRAIMPEDMWVEPVHCRSKSVCCGSLPRAAGKIEAADRCADTNGREAVEKDADAIVTACMSCAFQLNMAQSHVRAVHFLELLYNWPINWSYVGQWMKVRFLFDDTMGVEHASEGSNRKFERLTSNASTSSASQETASNVYLGAQEAASDVSINYKDTVDISE